MLKKIFKNRKGVTFIELMVAIAVIAIISSIFVFYIQGDDRDRVEAVTEQLVADARYVRNLATSRATYDFGDGNGPVYPPGGYGIEFIDWDTGNPASYILFADKNIDGADYASYTADYDEETDGKIKEVILDDSDLRLDDRGGNKQNFYFTFFEENKAKTNMSYAVSVAQYYMTVLWEGPDENGKGYKSTITLGERSAGEEEDPTEGYDVVLGTIGYYYSIYTPPTPPPSPGNKIDPIQALMGDE